MRLVEVKVFPLATFEMPGVDRKLLEMKIHGNISMLHIKGSLLANHMMIIQC